jgi:hypothetical protein
LSAKTRSKKKRTKKTPSKKRPRTRTETRIAEAFRAKFSRQRLLATVLSVVAVTGLWCAGHASADDRQPPKPYALIFGTVWDPDGRPLYGVTVKIRRADEKKARWELYSDHAGEFAQRVPAGKADYVVWADVKGYKLPSGRKLKPGAEIAVHIDGDERSDIGLHLEW